MKPYKISKPKIWVTGQDPIFYGGKIIRIKPIIIFEEISAVEQEIESLENQLKFIK